MHMIVMNGGVECPACGLSLVKLSEQDKRVALMEHPATSICELSKRRMRVDRSNGFSEVQNDA